MAIQTPVMIRFQNRIQGIQFLEVINFVHHLMVSQVSKPSIHACFFTAICVTALNNIFLVAI